MGHGLVSERLRLASTERELPATVLAIGVFLVVTIFTPFTTDIFMVAKITCLAAATATASILNLRLVAKRKIALSSHSVVRYAAAYLFVVLVATIFSRSPLRSMMGGYERFGGLLTVVLGTLFAGNLAVSCWGQPHRAKRVIVALEVGASAAAVYAVCQYFGIDAFTFREQAGNLAKWPGSTLGNSNFLGGLLACTLPMAVSRVLSASQLKLRVLAAASVATQTSALWFSQSRGGMIAAAVGVSTLLVLARLRLPRVARKLAIPALVGSAAVVVLAASAIITPWTQDLPGPLRKLDVLRSESAVVRGWEWRAAIVATGDRPVLGNGPDTYILAYPPSRVRADGANLGLLISDKPHNLFLEQLAGIGFLGAAVWVALIVVTARTGWRARRNDASVDLTNTIFATGSAYLTASLFSIDVPPMAMIFWVVGGLLIALDHDRPLDTAPIKAMSRSKRVLTRSPPAVGSAIPIVAVATGVACIAAFGCFAFLYSDIRAHAADVALAREDFQGAAGGYAAASAVSPFIAEYRRAAAFGLEQTGLAAKRRQDRKLAFADAAAALDEALRIEPGNVGYLVTRAQLATISAVTIDARLFDDANERWQRAVDVDPHDVELRRAFADALNTSARATNDDSDQALAIVQYEVVTELRPNDDNAWLQLGLQQLRAKRYDDAIKSAQRSLALRKNDGAVLLYFEASKQKPVATE